MSIDEISIKNNKHRIHPCPKSKKTSLLNSLISQNNNLSIIVVTANETDILHDVEIPKNVTIINDNELFESNNLTCELLISFDLPLEPATYIQRVSKATVGALLLLDIEEQQHLYPIETLLGRAIKQEIIEGFAYEIEQKPLIKAKYERSSVDKKYSERKPFDKPKWDKPKREGEQSERKPFDKPKYDKFKKDGDKPNWDRPKREGEQSERKPFDKPKYDKFKKDGDKPKWDKPKREGEQSERKPFDKFKKDDKNDKKPNKFLGKDESGKAKFSSKSGDRNHRYDGKPKDKYEAPKKEGRKIPIKERKPKEDKDSNS